MPTQTRNTRACTAHTSMHTRTQAQMHARDADADAPARVADADADALTRRCRRSFGRTCIDRDGVRFRGFRYWVGITNYLEAETEHAKYSNHLESYRTHPSTRLTGLLTTQSGEKTSSSNGSGVQLGGRHGIGIIFNGGLAVFKRARRFAIGCLCGSRIWATLRIPPPCHWQHSIENLVQETPPSPKLMALGIGVYEGFFAPMHRCTGTPRGLTHRDTDTSSVARSPINRNIDCRVRTDTPIPIGTTAKQFKHGRIPR